MNNNMDKFVEAMRTAMELAKDIEGIHNIHWNLGYNGEHEAVSELVAKMDVMMHDVNGNSESYVKDRA
jgi:hypothetical protein